MADLVRGDADRGHALGLNLGAGDGLAVRVEWLDGNTDFDDEHDGLIVTGTATVYAVRNLLKVQVEYTHREELHGPSVDNDAALAGVQLTF